MSVHFEVQYEWKTRRGRRWLSATDRFEDISKARSRCADINDAGGDEHYEERHPRLFRVEELSV